MRGRVVKERGGKERCEGNMRRRVVKGRCVKDVRGEV